MIAGQMKIDKCGGMLRCTMNCPGNLRASDNLSTNDPVLRLGGEAYRRQDEAGAELGRRDLRTAVLVGDGCACTVLRLASPRKTSSGFQVWCLTTGGTMTCGISNAAHGAGDINKKSFAGSWQRSRKAISVRPGKTGRGVGTGRRIEGPPATTLTLQTQLRLGRARLLTLGKQFSADIVPRHYPFGGKTGYGAFAKQEIHGLAFTKL